MKPFYPFRLAVPLLLLTTIITTTHLSAQVQTARNISIDTNTHGFYEYLPQGYQSGNSSYPLLVFLHGLGELGNGTSQLSTVLRNGPPKLINNGSFPVSFTVNNQTFKFIVISPQFAAWPTPWDVDNVINYAITHYRVDQSRIYLTGLSMGGGATWNYAGGSSTYANRLAAIVPISGASYPDNGRSRIIATANLPVWALQNLDDPTVPSSYTTGYIANINKPPAPTPPAKMTIFNVSGHDAWTQSYDPAYKEDNMNVYEWMLQFTVNRNVILPILLSDYQVFVSGEDEVSIGWTTSSEQNNNFFTIERSTDGLHFVPLGEVAATNLSGGDNYLYIDKNPAAGNDFYRLSQTDVNGKTTDFEIKKVVVGTDNQNKLSVFPNPADDYLTVQLDNKETGALQIRIISPSGKIEASIPIAKQQGYWQQQVSVAGLAAGYHIIEVSGKQTKIVQGFIKK